MDITFAYLTFRAINHYEWFIEGLNRQLDKHPEINAQIIRVQYNAGFKEPRYDSFRKTLVVEPLPSPFQGRYQISKNSYYAAATARNTAFVHAIHGYVVCVDDLCVIGPKWLDAVIEGCKNEQIILGTYSKARKMVVEDGILISSEYNQDGQDSRSNVVDKDGKTHVPGNLLYGCCFATPLESMLEINGFDVMCDVSGYEDQITGHRLQRSGVGTWYDRRMLVIESEEDHHEQPPLIRIDPETSRDRYFEILKSFGVEKSKYREPFRYDSSHAIVDIGYNSDSYKSHWNNFSLRDLRWKRENGIDITLQDMNYPEKHWFIDELITEM